MKVESFEADIVCKNDQNNFVVIENQLKQADHKHLGQVLTYAGGLPAAALIWIAERFHPGHSAALDWLNEHTNEGTDFYGIEVELVRIGNSPWAPSFNIVSKPNEFSKETRAGVVTSISPERQLEFEFWKALRDHLNEKSDIISEKGKVAPREPLEPNSKNLWKNYGVFRLEPHQLAWNIIAVRSDPGELRVLVHLEGDRKRQSFDRLRDEKSEIEQQLSGYCKGIEPLHWRPPAGLHGRAGRISVFRSADIKARDKWPDYLEWLRTRLEAFYLVFQPRWEAISKEIAEQEVGERSELADPALADSEQS
jgi:Domain of unknown function (DUF4268)